MVVRRRRVTLVFDYRFAEDNDNNLSALGAASSTRFVQPASGAQCIASWQNRVTVNRLKKLCGC